MTGQGATSDTTLPPPGDSGVWVFIIADMCAFALFFLTYGLGRHDNRALYEASRASLDLRLGLANTVILLTSGAFMATAVRYAQRSDWAATRTSLFAALGTGSLFAISKAFEWHAKFAHGIGLTTNEFFTYYFVFTGIHFLHFIIGIGVIAVLLARCGQPLPQADKLRWLEAGGAYWHMVDLLWIMLFAMFYVTRG